MSEYWNLYRCTFDRLSNAERFVFAYIELFSRDGNTCEASQEYIANRLHIGIATVKRCMKTLEEKKLIQIMRGKPKKGDTWQRCRSKCKADRDYLSILNSAWKKDRSKSEERLPDVLRVNTEWLQYLGASTKCILFANMYQLKQAGEKLKDTDHRSQYIMYCQSDLAMQCGCKITTLKEALEELKKAGIVEQYQSVSKWEKSRKCYILNDIDTAGNDTNKQPEMILDIAGNDTSKEPETDTKKEFSTKQLCQNDTTAGNDTSVQPEMILDIAGNDTSVQPEMIPNEYIDEYIMNTSMNTDENKFSSSPIMCCAVSRDVETPTMHSMRQQDKMARSIIDLKRMTDEEAEAACAELNKGR